MNNTHIKIMGEPTLLEKSTPITEFAGSLTFLIRQLHTVMLKAGGIGIAAPQIGINKRVIIFETKDIPLTILINPEYEPISHHLVSDWEGCLSLPGMKGLVPRYKYIQYRGYDECGNLIEKTAEDFHARIIQHEVDHLDGILFPFRITDLKNFGFKTALSCTLLGYLNEKSAQWCLE